MNRKVNSCLLWGLALIISATSCVDQQEPPMQSGQLHTPRQNPSPLDNTGAPTLPTTPFDYSSTSTFSNAIVTLGRVLFYDKTISSNLTVSCASCHKQAASFADNSSSSRGFSGINSLRNAMPIHNLSLTIVAPDSVPGSTTNIYGSANGTVRLGGLFWDGRETRLEEMVLLPMINQIEMGNSDFGEIQARIANKAYYQKLFDAAFPPKIGEGDNTINHMGTAIAAFVTAIRISNTKYDQYKEAIKKQESPNGILSDVEITGMQLFETKYNCNSCHHLEELTMTPRFANIGLQQNYTDNGLASITNDVRDNGKFLVPSLRNVELTAPYMHDGSVASLDKVIEHYSIGVLSHPALHPDLKDENGNAKRMNISAEEADAIIAFLKTLTDRSVLTDPRFSDPFQ